jgi:hypothetical protein
MSMSLIYTNIDSSFTLFIRSDENQLAFDELHEIQCFKRIASNQKNVNEKLHFIE